MTEIIFERLDVQEQEKVKAGALFMERTGSRETCIPPPQD